MSNRAIAGWIFAFCLVAMFGFTPQNYGNSQIVTRLGLTLSLLDGGRVDIDRFANWTIDRAVVDGHTYADKTPGHSLLAVPAAALTRLVLMASGRNADIAFEAAFGTYARWATLGTNGLISALSVAVLFLVAVRLRATRSGAIFAAIGLGLATPFFGWSTAFFAHSVSGSLLLIAGALVIVIFDGAAAPMRWGRVALLGVIMSYTAVVDLTTVPTLVLLGIVVLCLWWRAGAPQPAVFLAALTLGALIGGLPLPIYNQVAFGSPVSLGYSSVVGFEGMQQGLFGVTWPSIPVIGQLLFGLYRGLLPLAPVLLLAPLGLYTMARTDRLRLPAIVISAVFLLHLLLNASYFYWDGGWSMGPRHLVPALPLLCLSLAFAWPRQPWGQAAALGLLAISVAISILCAAGGMFPEDSFSNPFFEYTLPRAVTPLLATHLILLAPSLFGFAWLLARAMRLDAARA